MIHYHRMRVVIALVAGIALLFTASPLFASGTKEQSGEPQSAGSGQESQAQSEGTDAELLVWVDEARSGVVQQVGERFTEEHGVEIDVQMMGSGDIRDQLGVAGPAGEGPDILIGAHDWLGQLVSNGLLEPIELGQKRDQFLDAALQAYTYNGELYGMPYQMDNVAFFRNTELVPEAPETWDEVTQIAAELESSGQVELGYVRQEGDPYHFFPIQTAFGGYVFGRTDNGSYDPTDVGIDSEGSIAAAQWLQSMVENGHMRDGVDYDIMHSMFEDGDAAMIITGPWALPRLRESGVPYAISDIPDQRADGRPFIGVQGFMISAFSENKLLAQTFLTEFIATEEVMIDLYEAVPRPIAYEPARDDVSDQDIAAFGAVGENGLPMPAIPEMSAVWSAWTDAIVLVTQGQQDARPAFENAAEQIRNTIQSE